MEFVLLLFLTCLIQSINVHAECLHGVNGDNHHHELQLKRLELMGFTSVWRAAQRWGKEGWVLKADSKREILV